MFRSKAKKSDAATSNVTVLEDYGPLADNNNQRQREELLMDTRHTAAPSSAEMDDMSEAQLQALIEESASAGKQATSAALRSVLEAREIGVSTAERMASQTAQLDKMTDDIEVVHDYLDQSESTIEKMTKNRLVRMFNMSKSKKGKGLDAQKATKKQVEAREAVRAQGLDSLDVRGMRKQQENTVAMEELQKDRAQLLGSAARAGSSAASEDAASSAEEGKRRKLFGISAGGKKQQQQQANASVETRNIKEDYSQYSEGVAKVLSQQDDDLDQISDVLGDVKSLATAMNHELAYQGEKIEEVQAFATETSRRTKQNARKVATIK